MSRLSALIDVGKVRREVTLSAVTTYKVGGAAAFFAEVGNLGGLTELAAAWAEHRGEILVVGRGSNLVISDEGFDGLVIRLTGEFATIEHRPSTIYAGGAAPLPALARYAVQQGRLGLEFYVGIPGSVGGAVRQNAGGHGSATAEWLVSASVFDLHSGDTNHRTPESLDLRYRHSNLRSHELVIGAEFGFEAGDPEVGETRIREVIRWRKEHQPGGALNAGSVFKNPPGDSAGRIIDSLGLKGFAVGKVSVSERHANFFVAKDGATAADIHRLVEEVSERVWAGAGIRLEPEILFVGRFA